jgi:hypothetical protein
MRGKRSERLQGPILNEGVYPAMIQGAKSSQQPVGDLIDPECAEEINLRELRELRRSTQWVRKRFPDSRKTRVVKPPARRRIAKCPVVEDPQRYEVSSQHLKISCRSEPDGPRSKSEKPWSVLGARAIDGGVCRAQPLLLSSSPVLIGTLPTLFPVDSRDFSG